MSVDASLIGTTRQTVRVAAYHNHRAPVGEPDEIVEREIFREADGTEIVDVNRINAIRAAQAAQAKDLSDVEAIG